MAKYCVAYKNDDTTKHAERTGNLSHGWYRISAWSDFSDTKRVYTSLCKQFNHSAVGIFFEHDNDPVAWYDRQPRYLHNRHVLFNPNNIRAAFGGLINSVESDYL